MSSQPLPIRSVSCAPARRSAGLRRWVALAMELPLPELHAGVVAYAVEAGWWGGLNQLTLPPQMPRVRDAWDGILALSAFSELAEVLKHCSSPVVQMYSADPALGTPAVEVDWEAVGAVGAAHLLERGYPTLVFYHKGRTPETLRMRDGFVEAVRAAGGEAVILDRVADQPEISSDASTPLSRVPWLAERLGGLPMPLAVMAEDDRFAIDVVSACLLSGLSIPDEVGVLGTDNDPRRYQLSPHPISSVDTDLFAVGYRAAALLERIMNGEAVAAEAVVVAPKGVVVRASTDTYALAGADVRAAYAWLCEHFRERRCASAAARESGTPVRTLQKRFKRATGRTLSEETTRLRLQHACQLLEQTRLKLTAIAMETGFSSYAHFCGLFERMIGLKPSEYRDEHRCTP